MSITKLTAAKDPLEGLNLLGVDHAKKPAVSRFPKAYNPAALKLWVSAIEQTDMTAGSLTDAWGAVIKKYLALCKGAECSPFNDSNIDRVNESVVNWLKVNRLQCIRYANDTEIFKHFQIASVKRSVLVAGQADRNFIVQNTAKLKAVDDPTIDRWLITHPMPGFLTMGNGKYCRQVNAATSIEINFTGRTSATISLTIYSHSLPIVPAHKTKKALAKYIETKIWVPLVEKYRFNGIGTKKF
jgi:hypothetical protein